MANSALVSGAFQKKCCTQYFQCLNRRIPDRETRTGEVVAWQEHRNASVKPANWQLRTVYARIKLKSSYSSIQ